MSLWTFGIMIASIFFVFELRKIRKEMEFLNGILARTEMNFIKNQIRSKK
jgi:hypothetical protein